jgi:hypothetical protein
MSRVMNPGNFIVESKIIISQIINLNTIFHSDENVFIVHVCDTITFYDKSVEFVDGNSIVRNIPNVNFLINGSHENDIVFI